MNSKESLENTIECLVRNREIEKVRRSIPVFLRRNKGDPQVLLLAADWFRRISDPHSALKVLKTEIDSHLWSAASATQIQMQLRLARILNMLGASSYALRIGELVIEHKFCTLYPEIGGIFLSNYQYEKARFCFQEFAQAKTSDLSYQDRFKVMALADAHLGLGNTALAIEMYQKILADSPEPLAKGIAYQALGAAYLKQEKLDFAWQSLEASMTFFPASDTTTDRGFLEKWFGAYFIKKNQFALAQKHLDKAMKLLFRRSYKPEGWLEVLYWTGLAEFINNKRSFPPSWTSLLVYPSHSHPFVDLIKEKTEIPNTFFISANKKISKPKTFYIDIESDIVSLGKSQVLGVDLQMHLLALLTLGGKFGVSQYRIYEKLWPEELFSISNHQNRLQQIVLRLRKTKFHVVWKDHHLSAKEHSKFSVKWVRDKKIKGFSFLRMHQFFKRQQIEQQFNLSRRAAFYICKEWLEAGAIEQVGVGQYKSKYFVSPNKNAAD